LAVTFVFIALRISGDPAVQILSPQAPPEAIEAFREAWGLNKPLWQQYVIYFGNILDANLGQSYRDGRDAVVVVMERVEKTLTLGTSGLIVMLTLGIPSGIYAALNRNSFVDRSIMTFAVVGYSLPNFFLGILLILFFSMKLGILPSSGSDTPLHFIMPLITLGTYGSGIIARFVRSSMLEVLGQNYIRTAQAKGVPWYRVVRWHAFPNAAIPTVTIVGFMVGTLIGGAVITETVFAWPGIGRLLVTAVANRDLAVVQVIILMITISMVITNLLIDLLYGWLDPRIKTKGD
jgi:peptide/nickel transport system permease protein